MTGQQLPLMTERRKAYRAYFQSISGGIVLDTYFWRRKDATRYIETEQQRMADAGLFPCSPHIQRIEIT